MMPPARIKKRNMTDFVTGMYLHCQITLLFYHIPAKNTFIFAAKYFLADAIKYGGRE
jgi:hypothetical protein